MLLLSHMSELMEKTLRRQREPLDGTALGASILLHAVLLTVMAFVHFKAPAPPQEKIFYVKLQRPRDEKPMKLAQAATPKPKPKFKVARIKPVKMAKHVLKIHRPRLYARGPRPWGKIAARTHNPRQRLVFRPHHTKVHPKNPELVKNTVPEPKTVELPDRAAEKPTHEETTPDDKTIPAPSQIEKHVETASSATDESGPKNFETEDRPKETVAAAPKPEEAEKDPDVAPERHSGRHGRRKSALEAAVAKPDLENPDDTPPAPAGVPDAPEQAEKRLAQVPGVVPTADPGGRPKGAGRTASAPGNFEVARRDAGDGGGIGLAPARHRVASGPLHPDLLASAGGPGDPELPAAAGAPGGVDKPGNDRIAPKIPEFGHGPDKNAGADDFRRASTGIAIASGGGIPTVSEARARGSALEPTAGTGPKIATRGGYHGGGGLPGSGPGNGGRVEVERPGGDGGPDAGFAVGSGGRGDRKAAPGVPQTGGAGGENLDGPIVSKTGSGGGTPGAQTTDVARGDAAVDPGVPPGIGDGRGTGDGPKTSGITLPIGDPLGGLSGPGNGDGGPGEKTGASTGTRHAPNGVYVNTTGDFDVPLAVTSSDYDFNASSVNKVVDEINGRTKIKVKLGDQSAALNPAALKSSPVLVFNGHKAFRLTKEQRDAIRTYVAHGGMIWADFTGGKFDDSFVEEMRQVFGQDLQTLGAGHPIYNSYYRLDKIPAGDTGRAAPFEGIMQNGHLAVVVTRNRYLGAVAGTPHVSDDTQEGAVQAAINIYVYGAQNFKANRE